MPDYDTFYNNIEKAFGLWAGENAADRENSFIEVNLRTGNATVKKESDADPAVADQPIYIIRPDDYSMYDPDTATYTFNNNEISDITKEITIASAAVAS